MRINNSKHVPWIVFVLLATIAACILYVGNFHPAALPAWIPLPASLIQQTTEHHTVGGTPLGLWFGTISLAIFLFAVLLSLRKKIPLWRVGTVQRWLRAHIWLTVLTIPLVLLHSGFRFGGGMTTFLLVLYAIVMVSGFFGLFLQHLMPRLMKARLPAETVYEQIPHIRAQLAGAAGKMRDSFKPAPPKKSAAADAPATTATKTVTAPAAAMASTKSGIETPAARAKSVTGSAATAAPVTAAATTASAAPAEISPVPPPIPNAAVNPAPPKVETIGTPTARVQSDPPGAPVARSEVPAGDQPAPSPPIAPAARAAVPAPAAPPESTAAAAPKPAPAVAKPAAPPKPAAKPAPPPDPESEEVLVEFIERQILPYLQARRGDRMRLNNLRFSDDTFRYVKLRVAEGYRSRVEEIQTWCDERRMLDVQVRLHHWLHGWLFVHVPFSFLLVMVTIWHAFVTLFYY
jgi:hypothetical protein